MTIRKLKTKNKSATSFSPFLTPPFVRTCSFNTKPIEYEQHCNWFQKTIANQNVLFFLFFDEDTFVGQIRFNRESEQSNECVISLSITKEYRVKHIAGKFLELGIDELKKNWYNIYSVVAEVKDENTASNALFLREGFELISKVNTYKLSVMTSVCGGDKCRVEFYRTFQYHGEKAA